jgi:DNA-directed RNA polymerase specialized sigma24 family protein
MRPTTCALIAGQVSAYLDHALPENEASAIKAHLSSCADCNTYLTQLRTTMDILSRRPGIEVPNALREAIAAHYANDEYLTEVFTSSTPQMLAVARAIDPEHAEDLVQNTWIDVLRSPVNGTVEVSTLLTRLDTLADEHRATDVDTDRPRDDLITEIARAEPDTDADTAELYYPGLYPQNPDLGDWVDAPNSWPGAAQILSPEDESTTEELYGVVDAALADLPSKRAELLSLVDIEGIPLDLAVSTLRLDPESARRDLDRARDYVRHRVDTYLSRSEST